MNNRGTQRTQWLAIYITFIIGVVAAIAITKASPALLVMQSALALSTVQVGWIMSSVSIATVLLATFTGQIGKRFGVIKVIQIALLLLCVSSSFVFVVNSPLSIILMRALEGVAIILISVSAPTLISQLSKPSDTGLTMGLWSTWIPVGGIFVFLLSPFILDNFGWQWLWVSSAILALPLFFLLRFIPNAVSQPIAISQQERASRSTIFGAIILSSVFVCFACVLFSIFTYLPSFLMDQHQLSHQSALWVSSLLPICVIPGCTLCSVLIHKGSKPSAMMIYSSAIVALILSLVFNSQYSDSLGLVLLGLLGAFVGMIPTAIFAQAPRMPALPKDIATVMGIVVTGQGVGILFGIPLVGLLLGDELNWQPVYIFYLVMSALLILLAKPLDRLQRSKDH